MILKTINLQRNQKYIQRKTHYLDLNHFNIIPEALNTKPVDFELLWYVLICSTPIPPNRSRRICHGRRNKLPMERGVGVLFRVNTLKCKMWSIGVDVFA